MSKDMKTELEEIRAREAKATQGPWMTADTEIVGGPEEGPFELVASCRQTQKSFEQEEADADFIAHARTDIPTLLSHISTLEERVVFLEKALDQAVVEGSIQIYPNGKMYFGSYEYSTCSMPTAKDVPELAAYLKEGKV